MKKAQQVKISSDKVFEVVKTMTAMKLVKSDCTPGKVFDNLFIGSIGAAYNKEKLKEFGITHILTVAAKIKPRFEKDFVYKIINAIDTAE